MIKPAGFATGFATGFAAGFSVLVAGGMMTAAGGFGPTAARAAPADDAAGDPNMGVVVPRLSEQLGSVHAGATLCGLPDEAQAVLRKHQEHLGRLAQSRPTTDTRTLDAMFRATSDAYRRDPGYSCTEAQRREIQHKLPDVFASVDAYDTVLSASRQ